MNRNIFKNSKYQQYFIVLLCAYWFHMYFGLATSRISDYSNERRI